MNKRSDIGLIGLAVMGENLALNMERNGSQVSVYNRAEGAEATVVERFLQGRGAGKNFLGFTEIKPFVESIERPRKIMMMIRAGKPVDYVIESLLPYLEQVISSSTEETRTGKTLSGEKLSYVITGSTSSAVVSRAVKRVL